jgi:2'-5' RNA ligase
VRLFFALWPDEALRRRLERIGAELAQRTQGKAVPAAKVHLTLAFLGEVPEDRFAATVDAASRVKEKAFDLTLEEVGAFRSARVAWVGSTGGHPALTALQSALAAQLHREGFELESRPFAAHVTLARRITRPLAREAVEPITWRVREFVLVASDTAKGSYEVGRTWKLGG